MIQIQLLLSNTLHRQLFIVNLRIVEVRGGGTRLHYQNMSKTADGAWGIEKNVGTSRRDLRKNLEIPLDKFEKMVYNV